MVSENQDITESPTQENTKDKKKDKNQVVCHLKKTIRSDNIIKISLPMLLLQKKQNDE